MVKNRVRPRGLRDWAALPADGTGMAFPWSVIASAKLASGISLKDMPNWGWSWRWNRMRRCFATRRG